MSEIEFFKNHGLDKEPYTSCNTGYIQIFLFM